MTDRDDGIHFSAQGPGRVPAYATHWFTVRPDTPADVADGRVQCLVVEDDDDTRELLRDILVENDIDVLVSATGAAAISACQDTVVDVAVIDLGLPGMDGLSLCEALRVHSHARHAGMIACTGFSTLTNSARAAGFDAMMIKPNDASSLIECVRIGAIIGRARCQPGPR